MRHKLCLDVVLKSLPERAALPYVRRGNSQQMVAKIFLCKF